MSTDKIICIPPNNPSKRLLLGKKGRQNILCIGINPNTADSVHLDPTSRNVERIAQNNGYDGWFLVNLYPERTAKVALLETCPDQELFQENLIFIKKFILDPKFNIDTIWLAWGNDINSKKHSYLKKSAQLLFRSLSKIPLTFVVIGTNNSGHPTHPSPQAIAQKFRKEHHHLALTPFDFESYLSKEFI